MIRQVPELLPFRAVKEVKETIHYVQITLHRFPLANNYQIAKMHDPAPAGLQSAQNPPEDTHR